MRETSPRIRFTRILVFVGMGAIASTSPCASQESDLSAIQQQGRAVYVKQCQTCHGDSGQGGQDEGQLDRYDKPLSGDSTIGELATLIAETMPAEKPEECVGDNAVAVAEYIHFSFYSEAARVRNKPPRIALARLTRTQLRQSLADLYGGTRVVGQVDERGIVGEYYTGSSERPKNRKIERNDSVIDFDFGDDGPGAGIDAKDFFVKWEGGLLATSTGTHQIVIRSTCAFICYLGASRREFINNRVQSGERSEFQRSIVLTSGRVYPLRIEFYQRKRKTKQPPGRISVSWKTPQGVEEIIPQRNLIPSQSYATFSLQTQLPADDRSYGFERGSAVDSQWDQSTTEAALEFAEIANTELWLAYRRRNRDKDEGRKALRTFLGELVESAFRGPLDEPSRELYVNSQVDAEPDDANAIRRSLLLALKSPRFLYPLLDGDRKNSQRAANRLALTLFDSLPVDPWLLDSVNRDRFESPDEVRKAAQRMVGDFRNRAKTSEFFYEWLNLHQLMEIRKDSEKFPGFDERLVADLRASFAAFVDDVVWSDSSNFQELFTADWSYSTPRMASYYGTGWNVAAEAEAVVTPEQPETNQQLLKTNETTPERIGLLTHPFLMSGLAYHDSTSPIHRGVFLIRHVLGRTIRPPTEAFTPLSPDLHPDLTTRERVQLQTSPKSCQVCHTKINGLGFTLENYDAVGRYREIELDRKLDTNGTYRNRSEKTIQLAGVRELASFVADSEDAHRAFVSRAFIHFVKQPPAAFGIKTLDNLTNKFRDSNFNIRELIVEIAVVAATQPMPEE
jgi:cytochrome c5